MCSYAGKGLEGHIHENINSSLLFILELWVIWKLNNFNFSYLFFPVIL